MGMASARDKPHTPITGYKQHKDDWLSQMRTGPFVDHRIDEENVTVEVDSDTACVAGRFVIDAAVYSTRANW